MEGYNNPAFSSEKPPLSPTIETYQTSYNDNKSKEEFEKQKDAFKKYKIIKQCVLVVIWICIGMAGEIVGPTLPDLKDRLGVNYEEVAQVLIGKSFGMLAGAILGGFINERFYKHIEIIMAGSLVLMATAAAVTPFSRSVYLTASMFALNGFSEGIINTGGNTVVMHLFGDNSASPMHSLHFGFGLGALIAPQLARPFLSDDAKSDDDDDDDLTTPSPTTWLPNVTQPEWVDTSRIEIPYCIIAGAIVLFSFVLAAFYFKGPPEGFKLRQPNTKLCEMISPKSCAYGRFNYGVVLLSLLFFYYLQTCGGERAYGKFLFSFAQESDLNMNNADAANLQTAFWASFTFGRLLGVPMAQLFSIRIMILFTIIGNIAVSIILSIFAQQEVVVLWVGSCLIGIFISEVFPNGMTWSNMHLQVNSMTVMLQLIGVSAGDFAYNYLTGYVFERDPHNLMYVMIGYAGGLALVYFLMEVTVKIAGPKGDEEEDDDQLDEKVEVPTIAVVYCEENEWSAL